MFYFALLTGKLLFLFSYQFEAAAAAFVFLNPIVIGLADQLIAGNDGGITNVVATLVTAITNPLSPIKLVPVIGPILNVITPFLNLIKNCNNAQLATLTLPIALPTALPIL